MALKFEIINNALVVTDTVTSAVVFDRPTKDTYYQSYELDNGNIVLYDISGVHSYSSQTYKTPLSSAVDSGSTPFTAETFRIFARENLGKSSPQGGGSIGITGNIVDDTDPQNLIIDETITTLSVVGANATYTSEDNTQTNFTLGDRYKTTSTTSNTIVSSGPLTFTVDSNLSYVSKQDVLIVFDSLNYMQGEITSYDSVTGVMIVDVKHKAGSGTYSNWVINIDSFHSIGGVETVTGDIVDNTDPLNPVISLSSYLENATIYGQFSDTLDQTFTANTPTPINFNTNDELQGITHSETVNNSEFTINYDGIYNFLVQPQVSKTGGGLGKFYMWVQLDTGSGFQDIANSNVVLTLGTNDEDVIPLNFTGALQSGWKVRFMCEVDDAGVFLDSINPTTSPVVPSCILSAFKLTNLFNGGIASVSGQNVDDTDPNNVIVNNEIWYKEGGTFEATNNTENIYRTGNVGIGTDLPTSHLHVKDARPKILLEGTNETFALVTTLELNTSQDFRARGVILSSNNKLSKWFVGVPYTGNGFHIGLSDVSPDSKSNSQFYIDENTGVVGIGTSSTATTSGVAVHLFRQSIAASLLLNSGTNSLDANAFISSNNDEFTIERRTSNGAFVSTPFFIDMQTPTDSFRINNLGEVSIGTNLASYKLRVNGSVAGVGAYVNLSDERYKEYIKPLNLGLNEILQLESKSFKYKEDETNTTHLGYIAQDVINIIPDAVDDRNKDQLMMRYESLIPVMTNAIKELNNTVTELKKEIEILKNK